MDLEVQKCTSRLLVESLPLTESKTGQNSPHATGRRRKPSCAILPTTSLHPSLLLAVLATLFLLVLLSTTTCHVARAAKVAITFNEEGQPQLVIQGDDEDDDNDDVSDTSAQAKGEGSSGGEADKKKPAAGGEPGAAAVSSGGEEDEGEGDFSDAEVERHKAGGAAQVHTGWWKVEYDMPPRLVKEGVEEGSVDAVYALGIKKLLGGVGTARDISKALALLKDVADKGHVHAQSALAFMHATGLGVPISREKAFLYHTFAARGGSFYSKMALAYDYLRQQEHDVAVELYSDVAARSMAANSLPGDAPLVEMVRLNDGAEENREAMRFHKGEDDETIQYIEYTAKKGSVDAIRTLGHLYYWGARGMPRDHARAMLYFRKAAEAGDVSAMLTLGEMLARGIGTPQGKERASEALVWFQRAAGKGLVAAHNAIGYLYAKGKGVEQNYTKAMEHFNRAARHGDADGIYNMGLLHLRGKGVARNVAKAFRFLSRASEGRHVGAMYQLARMHHRGIGTSQPNLPMAVSMYKAVAERGPWGSLLRWAHECYMGTTTSSPSSSSLWVGSSGSSGGSSRSCNKGTAFLLYARAAELGYEVAQSNAAWVLDRLPLYSPTGSTTSSSSSSNTGGSGSGSGDSESSSSAGGSDRGRNDDVESEGDGEEGDVGVGESSSGGKEEGESKKGGGLFGSGLSIDISWQSVWSSSGVSKGDERRKGSSTSTSSSSSSARGAACVGPSGAVCTLEERGERSLRLWRLASEQGNVQALLLVGDAYYYGRGAEKDLERAVEAYRRAKDMKNAQAMFNLGFMHEHGLGLPPDLHLAKRLYDEALAALPAAAVPVKLALFGLWLRMRFPADSAVVKVLDTLPNLAPQVVQATHEVVLLVAQQDDSNKALFTLLALLLAVLFVRAQLRQRQQQQQQQQVAAGPEAAALAAAAAAAGVPGVAVAPPQIQ